MVLTEFKAKDYITTKEGLIAYIEAVLEDDGGEYDLDFLLNSFHLVLDVLKNKTNEISI